MGSSLIRGISRHSGIQTARQGSYHTIWGQELGARSKESRGSERQEGVGFVLELG